MNSYLQWMTKNTASRFWNDSANSDDVEVAILNGGTGITTNPVITTNTLKAHPDYWATHLEEIDQQAEGEALAMERTKCVATHYASRFFEIHNQGKSGRGYVCAQVNPIAASDKDHMLKQAKWLQSLAPNIAVKLPATRAGIQVYEECVAQGINVVGTLGFSVSQSLVMGEAHCRGLARAKETGIKPGLAVSVMMVGRLDDYLRDCVKDSSLNIAESDIVQAGIACIKEAYRIFKQRGYTMYLMPAGIRTPAQITELAGADMIMSISPAIAARLADCPHEERIDIPVATDVIERLSALEEFRRAYNTFGMVAEEFITFGPVSRTSIFFIENGWNRLIAK